MNYEEMTIQQLRDYVNGLSNEEIDKFVDEFERDEIDPIELLNASKMYDYLQYKQNGNADIEI